MEGVIAIFLIFGGLGLCGFSITPIGRAISARIRGGGVDVEKIQESLQTIADDTRDLMEDNRALHDEIAEMQERIDFTERLLTSGKEGGTGLR
ncbi:MAG: hypothetical protein IH877_09160 [Gemmatimonadetes bacterium]|nr:hypothetical protein [Gemmatimonadota bacterium]